MVQKGKAGSVNWVFLNTRTKQVQNSNSWVETDNNPPKKVFVNTESKNYELKED